MGKRITAAPRGTNEVFTAEQIHRMATHIGLDVSAPAAVDMTARYRLSDTIIAPIEVDGEVIPGYRGRVLYPEQVSPLTEQENGCGCALQIDD